MIVRGDDAHTRHWWRSARAAAAVSRVMFERVLAHANSLPTQLPPPSLPHSPPPSPPPSRPELLLAAFQDTLLSRPAPLAPGAHPLHISFASLPYCSCPCRTMYRDARVRFPAFSFHFFFSFLVSSGWGIFCSFLKFRNRASAAVKVVGGYSQKVSRRLRGLECRNSREILCWKFFSKIKMNCSKFAFYFMDSFRETFLFKFY